MASKLLIFGLIAAITVGALGRPQDGGAIDPAVAVLTVADPTTGSDPTGQVGEPASVQGPEGNPDSTTATAVDSTDGEIQVVEVDSPWYCIFPFACDDDDNSTSDNNTTMDTKPTDPMVTSDGSNSTNSTINDCEDDWYDYINPVCWFASDGNSSDMPTPPEGSGATGEDAGTSPVDAGTPPADVGTPPADAGTPPTNAETPPADAGTPADAPAPAEIQTVVVDPAVPIDGATPENTTPIAIADTSAVAGGPIETVVGPPVSGTQTQTPNGEIQASATDDSNSASGSIEVASPGSK